MRKIIFLTGLIFLVGGILASFFIPAAWFSVPADGAPIININIVEGMTVDDVTTLLFEKGLIQSRLAYKIYMLFDKSAQKVKVGSYPLKSGMSYRLIARTIALGPTREEVQIKIIEGWSNEAMGLELSKYNVSAADWLSEVGSNKNGKPMADNWRQDFSFLKDLPADSSLEGFLFPDTYRVWKDQLPQGLIAKQLSEFEKRATHLVDEAKKQGRTLHEVVTLASIVEKEVADPEDRKIVAGIFLNRIKRGMPLQSDATISYLTGSGRARSNLDELGIDSPFNTYKYKGLPPAPICNPGETALEAALNPAASDYFYFLTDEEGKTYYAKTLEEHAKNRARAFGE
ncbi:MAG: endolytic transglycosylase MltG [Patescibacteria group bacterium]